jgi:hypothetical protein
LTCDNKNDYPYQPCICNRNTEDKQDNTVGNNNGPVDVTQPTPATPVPSCGKTTHEVCTDDDECCSNRCSIAPQEIGQSSGERICQSVPKTSKQKLTTVSRGGAGGAVVPLNGGGRKLIRGSKK